MSKNGLEEKTRNAYQAARLASVGLEFAFSVLIGLLGGNWVDGKLDSAPWGLLIGLLLGLTAGVRGLLRAVRIAQARVKAQDEARAKAPEGTEGGRGASDRDSDEGSGSGG